MDKQRQVMASKPIGICGDGKPLWFCPFVQAELASGFIDLQWSRNREPHLPTWYAGESGLTMAMGLSGLVSDKSRLVKLAFGGIGMSVCQICSISCMLSKFRQCNCSSTGATRKKQHQGWQEKLKRFLISPPPFLRCRAQITVLQAQQTNWKSTKVKTISKLHVPNYSPLWPQIIGEFNSVWVTHSVAVHLANVERLGQTCSTPAAAAIDVRQRQIPAAPYQGQFMPGKVGTQVSFPNPRLRQHWVLKASCLAHYINKPKRHGTPNQTGLPPSHSTSARSFSGQYSFTHTETLAQQQQWIDWAIWMCAKFQRTSSSKLNAMATYLVPSFSSGLHGTNLKVLG